MRRFVPAMDEAREYLSKLHGCVAHPVLWREFNSLPAPHTRRAASFSIRFISKTGGAGWGSRGSPPLLGLRCPNFSKASWGSWGRLSEGVQCRPFIESKTDAKPRTGASPATARLAWQQGEAVRVLGSPASRIPVRLCVAKYFT